MLTWTTFYLTDLDYWNNATPILFNIGGIRPFRLLYTAIFFILHNRHQYVVSVDKKFGYCLFVCEDKILDLGGVPV